MRYDEAELAFDTLSSRMFEELFFALVSQLGFSKIAWRQGGADSGRDIEALKRGDALLVDPWEEKWFFECKRHAAGVGVKHVSSKFDWADAEGADHLVLILSCYPTNPCRDWIGKKRATARFKVHVVDGKHLKQVLLKFPPLLERYFASPIQRVLRNSIVDWALCALLPEVGRVSYVLCNSDLSRLDSLERACLLASSAASRSG